MAVQLRKYQTRNKNKITNTREKQNWKIKKAGYNTKNLPKINNENKNYKNCGCKQQSYSSKLVKFIFYQS